MLAYALNKRILLQKYSDTKNKFGTPEKTWSDYRYTWAGVKYTGGGTDYEEYGAIAHTNAEFTIRYNSQITYDYRIYYANQFYKILHIEIIGNNEGLRLVTIKFEDD